MLSGVLIDDEDLCSAGAPSSPSGPGAYTWGVCMHSWRWELAFVCPLFSRGFCTYLFILAGGGVLVVLFE